MIAADLIAALDLPPNARLDQRIPKKMLVENGAPTSADKRRINEGVEEVIWVAALKPSNIGVPEYRDTVREYLEIALLNVTLRSGAKAARVADLVHRAVPYPVLLVMAQDDGLTLSLVHKRWSQGEGGKTVLDGSVVDILLPAQGTLSTVDVAFLQALALGHQPQATLYELYQGWIEMIVAVKAARVTGHFTVCHTPGQAAARLAALQRCRDIDCQIASLTLAASKEKQLARQVAINLDIKALLIQRKLSAADL
jgi:hypothetical protein